MFDPVFDDPTKPRAPAGYLDRFFQMLILFTYLRLAFMFVLPYCIYATVRDAIINVASADKVYILERNPYLWDSAEFLPSNQANGKVTCYAVVDSVEDALDWLRSRNYGLEELHCESDGLPKDFFARPQAENGRFPAELESVVELVIDYGNGHTVALCQQGELKPSGFKRIHVDLPNDISRCYDSGVVYKRYGGRLGPVEVFKNSNGIWCAK